MEISSITDNKSLYDAIQSSKPVMDKILRLEISELVIKTHLSLDICLSMFR